MTGMAVLLLVRPIVRHRDRFAQSDERGDGWARVENIQTECQSVEVRMLAFSLAFTLARDAIKEICAKSRSRRVEPAEDRRPNAPAMISGRQQKETQIWRI